MRRGGPEERCERGAAVPAVVVAEGRNFKRTAAKRGDLGNIHFANNYLRNSSSSSSSSSSNNNNNNNTYSSGSNNHTNSIPVGDSTLRRAITSPRDTPRTPRAPPSLRDELRALVDVRGADPACAVVAYARKRACASQAAALAASLSSLKASLKTSSPSGISPPRLSASTILKSSAFPNASTPPMLPPTLTSAINNQVPKTRERINAWSSETLRRLEAAPREALLRAAGSGDAEKVRLAWHRGGGKGARDAGSGDTALLAAARSGSRATVEMCIKLGAEVNALNDAGETALHLASYAGYLKIVETLLGCGAQVQSTTEFAESPVFFAARKGHAAVARVLVVHGDNPAAKDRFGDTALEQAADTNTRNAIVAAMKARKAALVKISPTSEPESFRKDLHQNMTQQSRKRNQAQSGVQAQDLESTNKVSGGEAVEASSNNKIKNAEETVDAQAEAEIQKPAALLMLQMPSTALQGIFAYLDTGELGCVRRVSSSWSMAAEDVSKSRPSSKAGARPAHIAIGRQRPQSSPLMSLSEERFTMARQNRKVTIASARQVRDRSRIFCPESSDVMF